MYVAKYSKEKPQKCRECFWGTKKGRCRLGVSNCYYMTAIISVRKDDCDCCPYKQNGRCIGWCTKRVLNQPIICGGFGDYDGGEKDNGNW